MTHRIFESNIKKCPKCNHQIKSWESRCPKCGHVMEKEKSKEISIEDEVA